jgi:putative endonuclease
LYTGISNNVEHRVESHNSGKGAKYTRGRTPVILRFTEKINGKSGALKREMEIKKMSREEKQRLYHLGE